MIIKKTKESLDEASQILEEILSKRSFSSDNDPEIEKWILWFQKQNMLFKVNKISIPRYFAQINRFSSFLISKTSLEKSDLFEMEKEERKKIYNLTERETIVPTVLSNEEFRELAEKLFTQITRETKQNLKKNDRVEVLIRKIREKKFGFPLDIDPQVNIDHIIEGELHKSNLNKRNFLLGELFLDLQKPQEAKNFYEKVTSEELRASGLLKITCFEKNFEKFAELLKKAFPESYLPKSYGRYVLSFMIGSAKYFMYEVEDSGQRNVTFAYSTGIIKIQRMDIFASFISDNRLSPDGRIGLWISPGKQEKQFTISNLIQLDFKQVLGWKDL